MNTIRTLLLCALLAGCATPQCPSGNCICMRTQDGETCADRSPLRARCALDPLHDAECCEMGFCERVEPRSVLPGVGT